MGNHTLWLLSTVNGAYYRINQNAIDVADGRWSFDYLPFGNPNDRVGDWFPKVIAIVAQPSCDRILRTTPPKVVFHAIPQGCIPAASVEVFRAS